MGKKHVVFTHNLCTLNFRQEILRKKKMLIDA
jgi:hypothetical protein